LKSVCHSRNALSSEEMTVNQVIASVFAARGVAVLRRQEKRPRTNNASPWKFAALRLGSKTSLLNQIFNCFFILSGMSVALITFARVATTGFSRRVSNEKRVPMGTSIVTM